MRRVAFERGDVDIVEPQLRQVVGVDAFLFGELIARGFVVAKVEVRQGVRYCAFWRGRRLDAEQLQVGIAELPVYVGQDYAPLRHRRPPWLWSSTQLVEHGLEQSCPPSRLVVWWVFGAPAPLWARLPRRLNFAARFEAATDLSHQGRVTVSLER